MNSNNIEVDTLIYAKRFISDNEHLEIVSQFKFIIHLLIMKGFDLSISPDGTTFTSCKDDIFIELYCSENEGLKNYFFEYFSLNDMDEEISYMMLSEEKLFEELLYTNF